MCQIRVIASSWTGRGKRSKEQGKKDEHSLQNRAEFLKSVGIKSQEPKFSCTWNRTESV